MSSCKIIVEIRLSSQSRATKRECREVASAILSSRTLFRSGLDEDLLSELQPRFGVEAVRIVLPWNEREVPFFRASVEIYVYRNLSENCVEEQLRDDSDGSTITLFSHRLLPAAAYEGVWENLILEEDTKEKLLAYADSSLLFSDQGVDANVIACNRVVLLHGPPGTGKTSLCQALAQKVAIYTASRYPRGAHMLEVNSHALFSRWFSESGKLVSKMFEQVRDIASERKSLVFVLIDEVESLTSSRSRTSASDPSDAVRVVNSMLTQIDKLKEFPNVMILATSNLTDQIDPAFLDRADIRLCLENPGPLARRKILVSCIEALMRAGIVQPVQDLTETFAQTRQVPQLQTSNGSSSIGALEKENYDTPNYWLNMAVASSDGMSGRALRKLPLQAHSFYVRDHSTTPQRMLKALYDCILSLKSANMAKLNC